MSRPGPRVAVVHNEPVLPADHPDAASERDVVGVARAVADALNGQGFEAEPFPAGPPLPAFLDRLGRAAPDLVFNLIEGFGGSSGGASAFTAALELTALPFTGSGVEAFVLCQSKARAKALLKGSGLPTAPWRRVGPGDSVGPLDFPGPYLVKPDAEDGSLGIDQGSVVATPGRAAARVERLRAAYGGAAIVEAYLPGPEFNVGLAETDDDRLRALPVAQVRYADRPGAWPILTYDAKWAGGSAEDLASPVVCPAPVEPELAARLQDLAASAFRATACRDYARVDFRLDARGEPMVLEVNPNPDLGPAAGWARASRAGGRAYDEAVATIARRAYRRAGRH